MGHRERQAADWKLANLGLSKLQIKNNRFR